MRSETVWIIEPNWQAQPEIGYFASKPSKGMPESAIKISHDPARSISDNDRWRMYINGRITHRCATWKELAIAYGHGLVGRPLTADQYDRLLQERINDERDGGIVPVDPMQHPAPSF